MNKTSLVSEVVKRTNLPRPVVAKVVESILEVVRTTVAAGQRVSLAGFGTFERRRRNARTGRNPRTREAVKIPARNVPAFRPGSGFRDDVAAPRRRRASAKGRTPVKRPARAR